MSDNQNKGGPPKKSFPGSFFLFLFAAIFIVFVIQNFSSQKSAKVSFSHQLEHLTNLDLIHPEESRKTALNDNLVTFSGKFKSAESPEGKARYRFLELLNKNHEYKGQRTHFSEELNLQEKKVKDAAEWFLKLSGLAVPASGYTVVGSVYDSPDRANRIKVKSTDNDVMSLKDLEKKQSSLNQASEEQLSAFNAELGALVQNFRSPILGIADPAMKQQLKTISDDINTAQDQTSESQVATYTASINQLHQIVGELNQSDRHTKLNQLRSVKAYKEELDRYNVTSTHLEENQAQLDHARKPVASVIWFFNNKELSTRALEKQDPEAYSQWFANAEQEMKNFPANKGYAFKAPDQPRNTVLERKFKSEEPAPNYFSYLFSFMPIILIVLLLWFVFSRQMKGMGNNAMNFGKSTAKMLNKSARKVTFEDVAGIDEAKEELSEIVDFLKNPAKFTALGGKIPKGVLCVGPPGTGKTLIARAIAGEADRPFFSISGSDFVEMFVGVGASRVRDLFGQAKKQAPCIIFIDEIDAVGRHRGSGMGGGHDEREQTLNQLLVEMDGFDANEGVIMIAATNRPDVLDKALLRPGRFDRRVIIDLPDLKGRYAILKVHARKIKLDPSVDLMALARGTAGSSGADLENLLNEAALLASRRNRTAVTNSDTLEAADKVRYGKERRSLELSESEKKTTAIHEAGHAIVALRVEHSDPVSKVTIIPRGFSLGATHFLPEKNRVSWWKKELHDQLAVLLGGRVAEDLFIGDISSGAQNDIERATAIARNMICEWGMCDALGNVALDEPQGQNYTGMPSSGSQKYSEKTAQIIDVEVRKLIDDGYKKAVDLIKANEKELLLMTDMLMEFESLDAEDVRLIMAGKWDTEEKRKRTQQIEDLHKQDTTSTMTAPPAPPNIQADRGTMEGAT